MRAENLVAEINRLDLLHRKGFRHSDSTGKPFDISFLEDEVMELNWAIEDLESGDGELDAVLDECGDVLACLLQVLYRHGLTFAQVEERAELKMRMRFNGAEKISL